MDTELFQSIILKYQKGQGIGFTRRDLEIDFIPNMAIGIVGSRGCGKSFRTYQLTKELVDSIKSTNVCRIQFNDHRILKTPASELHVIDEAYYSLYPEKRYKEDVLFIFDEIHRIEGWEDYILYLLEDPTHKVVIIDSTVNLLKGEFSSLLRGKVFTVEVHPFSFREFIRHYKIEEDWITSEGQSYLRNSFKKYLTQGGFPGLLDIPKKMHSELLKTYWDTMLLRDIIEAHSSEYINIATLRYFADSLISKLSCPMSVSKLSHHMKSQGFRFAKSALYDYLGYLADAFMVFTVDFYSKSEKVKARNHKKVYCIDWALAQAVCCAEGIDKTRELENIVFIELRRRGYDISYYKTKADYEIDFVISGKDEKIELVQVSYSLEKDEVREREIRAIVKSAKFLESKTVTIVTFNEKEIIEKDGLIIKVIPIWRWLLDY